jgi:mannose-6-phosphate isomerase-like protein (cupin superfamily)
MRYVRPFDPSSLSPGTTSDWIVSPAEEMGVSMRLKRGGDLAPLRTEAGVERFALVLLGEAVLEQVTGRLPAARGSLAFIPAGQPGAVSGNADAVWVEIEASAAPGHALPAVASLDPARFEGAGFAYQRLADRSTGVRSMRVNTLQVQAGAGSPDFHIHTFAQLYVVLDGEMTLDVGRARLRAGPNSIVCLPPGVVHRNFNASDTVERHVSLLVPEPIEGAIFDYAVRIEEREAQLLTRLPD